MVNVFPSNFILLSHILLLLYNNPPHTGLLRIFPLLESVVFIVRSNFEPTIFIYLGYINFLVLDN